MRYLKFLESIKECVSKKVSERYGDGYVVTIQKVLKNNSQSKEALLISSSKADITPTIYLKDYYCEYKGGKELDEIASDIINIYERSRLDDDVNVEVFKDFDKVKDRIVFKIINTNSNKKLLERVPHRTFMDLSIVCFCILDNNMLGKATALVHNSHILLWGIDEDELFERAFKNTPIIMKPVIKSMREVLSEILTFNLMEEIGIVKEERDMELSEETVIYKSKADNILDRIDGMHDEINMFVLTNSIKLYGASCIAYKDCLKEFATEHGTDEVYIIPSSVHEVILIPNMGYMNPREINTMIEQINITEVEPTDVLSNHIYKYRRETNEIMTE
ncbi:MAG TPA: hypothetical protein DCW44_01220 [Eubacterium sp.]|nr:hypothetical protein [Eubacterium sp.]